MVEKPILKTKNLKKHFGRIKAVDGVNIEIPKDKIVSLIGPNGAGKTTFFNLVTGAIEPDAGKVIYQGEDITDANVRDMMDLGIGRTFQTPRPFSSLSVEENSKIAVDRRGDNLSEALFLPKKGSEEIRARVEEVLSKLGIEYLIDKNAGVLNVGQQKLLEIAKVAMGDPKLFLLDEPVAGVPDIIMERIMDYLRYLKEQGKSVMVIEHRMEAVMSISDEIFVLHNGKKLAHGEPKEISENEEVQEAYMG